MGFYIFLFIRVIILPFILFKIFRSKLKNPFWSINILFLPIMWAIYFFFYPYAQLTLICALISIIVLLILGAKSFGLTVSSNLKESRRLILINFFEVISLYVSSAFCSGSDLPGSTGYIYLFWIRLLSSK